MNILLLLGGPTLLVIGRGLPMCSATKPALAPGRSPRLAAVMPFAVLLHRQRTAETTP